MSAIKPQLVRPAFSEPAIDRSDELHVSQQSFSVSYAFPVVFCRSVFGPGSRVLSDVIGPTASLGRHRLLVFVDAGVLEARPSLADEIIDNVNANGHVLQLAAEPVAIVGGEGIKQGLEPILDMQRLIVELRIDRHSYIVAIGGGAVLDAVGLAAATAHRGIRHIRIPTTVLSQNDSGVGVKNGVNLFGAKNYFGTFAPPSAVINDYDFIESLPAREKRSGIAEAVKVALIRDRRFFEWLEEAVDDLRRFDADAMRYMIRRCAELHMHQIGQGGDPFERGTARPLDFGHWAAHRLEMLSEFSVRHGEAVAIGIALDTQYSVLTGLLDAQDASRVHSVLRGLGFSLWHELLEARSDEGSLLMQGLREFQEHLGGELTITLLAALGTGLEVHEIEEPLMETAIATLKERASAS